MSDSDHLANLRLMTENAILKKEYAVLKEITDDALAALDQIWDLDNSPAALIAEEALIGATKIKTEACQSCAELRGEIDRLDDALKLALFDNESLNHNCAIYLARIKELEK